LKDSIDSDIVDGLPVLISLYFLFKTTAGLGILEISGFGASLS
jgi:hypothetical protein